MAESQSAQWALWYFKVSYSHSLTPRSAVASEVDNLATVASWEICSPAATREGPSETKRILITLCSEYQLQWLAITYPSGVTLWIWLSLSLGFNIKKKVSGET